MEMTWPPCSVGPSSCHLVSCKRIHLTLLFLSDKESWSDSTVREVHPGTVFMCSLCTDDATFYPFPDSVVPITVHNKFNFESTDEITIFVYIRPKYFCCCFYF